MDEFRITPTMPSVEQLIEGCVERAIEKQLGPHLAKLSAPEPLVYTVAQAAEILQVSTDTVSRLMSRGVLDRVPHVEGKTLIPRTSVQELVANSARRAPRLQAVDGSQARGSRARRKSG